MAAYVVVPGIDGSDERHWQSRWEREWGGSASRISPKSWSAPDLRDWVDAVDEAYRAAAADADEVVLVAHSLGCWATTTWVRETRPDNVAAFLVAPPDPHDSTFPRQAAPTFLNVAARQLPCPALVVASENDPYCDSTTAASFASGWRAHWHLAGPLGHINSDSDLGDWPAGRDLLAGLTAQ
ncbi:RBBP9/YdeN family alpha/beta hydrolase [Actinopolyspora saharensis]|uniref:Alpha/beta hydrolase family protein n=1 Tax=Actinopolyspora saharensis TaxID=995062 RepID=A0A1H1EK31_9ACTN|nr:alpha/beta fold hydrolase [Actinopolyspora saharensis]SDQ89131.1 hypothetical protein SAMN04489718_2580 [Actinopolyspora saharensis]